GESSSSIMPLTAASTCSNRRSATATEPSRGTSCRLMIEAYPDSVLPRICRRPASQSSANFSNVTDNRRVYVPLSSSPRTSFRRFCASCRVLNFPSHCSTLIGSRYRIDHVFRAPPGLTIWPAWLNVGLRLRQRPRLHEYLLP